MIRSEGVIMATRREFLKWTAVGGAGLAVGRGLLDGTARAATSQATAGSPPTAAATLKPYQDPMPILADNAVDATGGGTVSLTTALISRKLHKNLPTTTLFGYLRSGGPGAGDTEASYLGPVILAQSGTAVKVNYTNG